MGNRMVRSAGTPLAPALARERLDELPSPTWRMMLGRGLPQFAGEALAPVLAFYVVWKLWGLAPAILASSVAYLVLTVWLVRRGRHRHAAARRADRLGHLARAPHLRASIAAVRRQSARSARRRRCSRSLGAR